MAVRATKDSDGFRRLVSEKPEWPAPAPAKREGLDGFGREASNGEEDGQVQGELAPWSVLNQLGVEVSACTRLGICRFVCKESVLVEASVCLFNI